LVFDEYWVSANKFKEPVFIIFKIISYPEPRWRVVSAQLKHFLRANELHEMSMQIFAHFLQINNLIGNPLFCL